MDNLGALSQSIHAITSAVQTVFTLGRGAKGHGASDEFTSRVEQCHPNTVMDAQRVAIEGQAIEGQLNSRIAVERELKQIGPRRRHVTGE